MASQPPISSRVFLQVTGIIASILEDHAPECAAVQSRLRECLAHNAGSPEKALLEHLVHLHGKPEEPQDEEPLG